MTVQSLSQKHLIYGVGINDADYPIDPVIGGKRKKCDFYRTWNSMLTRCYSSKTHNRQPRYENCSACNEWHSFMAFREWMIEQDWEGNHLDKDIIIPGNKIYSPEACCFVTTEINALLTGNNARRGDFPQGVSYKKALNKFASNISINNKQKHIGYFFTPEEAFISYCKEKSKHITDVADGQPEPIKSGLLKHAELYRNGEIK